MISHRQGPAIHLVFTLKTVGEIIDTLQWGVSLIPPIVTHGCGSVLSSCWEGLIVLGSEERRVGVRLLGKVLVVGVLVGEFTGGAQARSGVEYLRHAIVLGVFHRVVQCVQL